MSSVRQTGVVGAGASGRSRLHPVSIHRQGRAALCRGRPGGVSRRGHRPSRFRLTRGSPEGRGLVIPRVLDPGGPGRPFRQGVVCGVRRRISCPLGRRPHLPRVESSAVVDRPDTAGVARASSRGTRQTSGCLSGRCAGRGGTATGTGCGGVSSDRQCDAWGRQGATERMGRHGWMLGAAVLRLRRPKGCARAAGRRRGHRLVRR